MQAYSDRTQSDKSRIKTDLVNPTLRCPFCDTDPMKATRSREKGSWWSRLFSSKPATKDDRHLHPDYARGEYFSREGRYDLAARSYQKAAEEGSAAAQYNLGVMYLRGEGIPEDHVEAVRLFRMAAEHGLAPAQANLGLHLATGDGVAKDPAGAVSWFRKAASQGFADAQYKLGVMYANGEGVPQNYTEAFNWISQAAQQGHPEARQAREVVAKRAVFEQGKRHGGGIHGV